LKTYLKIKTNCLGPTSLQRKGLSLMTLAENISVGRKSIATARQRGVDTSGWEAVLADLEQQQLLAWAAEFAEADVTLVSPITYLETSLRPITTAQVSQSIRRYLKTVASAAIHRTTGGWGRFTSEWWAEQANESLGALKALRSAMAEANVGDQS